MSDGEVTVTHSIEVVDSQGDEYKISTVAGGHQVRIDIKKDGKVLMFQMPTGVWAELSYFSPEDDEYNEEEG